MAKPAFNFVSAAFFSCKALARRPGGVVSILVWQLILYIAVYAPALALMWPHLSDMFAALAQGLEPDDAMLLDHAGSLLAGAAIAVLGGLLALLLAQGAWLRLLTRDEIAAGIPFRLGGDEIRLAGVNILFLIFNSVFWGLLVIVLAVPNIAAQVSGGDTGAVLGGAAVSAVLVILAVVAWIIVAIRFAAAPAMTVQQKRFRLFGSFAATGGITAWLALVYLVLILIILVGYVFVSTLQNVIALLAAADLVGALAALDGSESPDVVFSILADIFTQPGVLIAIAFILGLQLIFQILYEVLWHGAGAYAAVRHVSDALGDEVSPSAPAASVGAAPEEG